MPVYRNDPNLISLWLMDDSGDLGADYKRRNNLTNVGVIQSTVDKQQGIGSGDFEKGDVDSLFISNAGQDGLNITGALTICAWHKAETFYTNVGNGTTIAGKYSTVGNQRAYWLWIITNAGPTSVLRANISPDGTNLTTTDGGTPLSIGIWYHMAMVLDGVDIRLYLSGVLDNTPAAFSSGIFSSTADFRIGDRGAGSTTFLADGLIDEVAIFNRALTAAEILDIKNQGILEWPPYRTQLARHSSLLRR